MDPRIWICGSGSYKNVTDPNHIADPKHSVGDTSMACMLLSRFGEIWTMSPLLILVVVKSLALVE
jgi:hypothetical protein